MKKIIFKFYWTLEIYSWKLETIMDLRISWNWHTIQLMLIKNLHFVLAFTNTLFGCLFAWQGGI